MQLETIKKTQLPCNLCGGNAFVSIVKEDRHGLPVESSLCSKCGLIAINPRMSPEDYDNLYRSGEIHRLWMKLNGKTQLPNFEHRYEAAYRFGIQVADAVGEYVSPGLLVEVGSGTGAVLAAFKVKLGITQVIGIDPSTEEAHIAEGRGIPTILKTFEACAPQDIHPTTVMSVQSLNHLYDPRAFFTWAHGILSREGKLVLVVQNFFDLARKKCSVKEATQIDHIFMFTPDTLRKFVTSAGFEILSFKERVPSSVHMTLVAQKIDRVPFGNLNFESNLSARVQDTLARIRQECLWRNLKRDIKRVLHLG